MHFSVGVCVCVCDKRLIAVLGKVVRELNANLIYTVKRGAHATILFDLYRNCQWRNEANHRKLVWLCVRLLIR